jgi:hypothetical protein
VSRNTILKQNTEAQLRGSVDLSKELYQQEMQKSLQKIMEEEEIQKQHGIASNLAIKHFNDETKKFGEGQFKFSFLNTLKMVCQSISIFCLNTSLFPLIHNGSRTWNLYSKTTKRETSKIASCTSPSA